MASSIVKVTDPKTNFEIEYYMDTRLVKNIRDKIMKDLEKKDKDCVLVIDGHEGSGKSTLAMQIGKFADPTLSLERIVFGPDQFREAILKAKKGQVIIYDEAFTGFSSRNSLSPINKVLVSLAMQMRQKNLFIIIVLPTIFLLDKYMAMFRTKALIHVFENKGVRGYFRIYNREKKKWLILRGAKTMSYKHKGLYTKFNGRFYGKFAIGPPEVEEGYRKNKETALADSEKTSMTSAQVKFREQRDLMIFLFKKNSKMTYMEIENLLADYELMISYQQIGKICAKFGNVEEIDNLNSNKIEESNDNSTKEATDDSKDNLNSELIVENDDFSSKNDDLD